MNQSDNVKILAAIAVSAAATFALRALPFVLLKYAKRYQKLFAFLGNVMPLGMMMILSLYCLAGLYWSSWAQAGVSFLACAAVLFLQHVRRQAVLSICCGLAVYVVGQSLLKAYVL